VKEAKYHGRHISIGAGYTVATKGSGLTFRIYGPINDAVVVPEPLHAWYEEMADAIAAEQAARDKASKKIGAWLSAALSDENVCSEMKEDIKVWFDTQTYWLKEE
jgi:hypothetical protein